MKKMYKNLALKSDLIDYIRLNHNINEEKIIYDTKYGEGSFTITTPKSDACNSTFINGYPHFNVPREVVLNEIYSFLDDKCIYDNDIFLRYGDTHPNKPVPNLAQTRNLYISEIFRNLLTTSGEFKSIYLVGDISSKNIEYVCNKIGKEYDEEYQRKIINACSLGDNDLINGFNNNNEIAIKRITEFLELLRLSKPDFVLESELYKNKKIYDFVKNDIICDDKNKKNGDIKYSLQELVYALYFNTDKSTLISLIGSNQSEHIKKVYNIIQVNNLDIDYNFLSYGICKNAKEREYEKWNIYLENLLKNKFPYIDISNESFLRLLYCGSSNVREIDFLDLNNFKNILKKYETILRSLQKNDSNNSNYNLLNKMSLVNYYIDLSIKNGQQHIFFDYLVDIALCYLKNSKLNNEDYELYIEFMNKCLKKLNIENISYGRVMK